MTPTKIMLTVFLLVIVLPVLVLIWDGWRRMRNDKVGL
jgi:hypothetical protein